MQAIPYPCEEAQRRAQGSYIAMHLASRWAIAVRASGVASEPPASECRQLPCLSICQDVVRKCPDMLRFFCPLPATYVNLPPYEAEGVHYPDYSADIADCNKLDRVTDPVDVAEVDGLSADDFPWPGAFDSAA